MTKEVTDLFGRCIEDVLFSYCVYVLKCESFDFRMR